MSDAGSGGGGFRTSVPPLPPSSYTCPHCSAKHPLSSTRCPETGEAVPAVNRMQGHVLEGKYRVLDMLGRGGMGIVYTGVHETTGRRLAIKFIHPEAATNQRAVTRFQNEARIAAMVRHRNVRTILDVGSTPEGVHYIVMEYLDGEPLAAFIDREGTLAVPEAVAITSHILDSLKAMHSKKIVHRDLKPDNVFLASETGGTRIVKVLDFGLSRLASAHDTRPARITGDGVVVGTPMYMAPEQARGARSIDHRADLFSVGVILYRMLTGRQPFPARSYNQYLVAVTSTDPPPPSTLREGLPADLDGILQKVLAREPDDRYSSAAEFAEALAPHAAPAPLQGGVPLAAGGPGAPEPGSSSSAGDPEPSAPSSRARSDLGEAKTVVAGPPARGREMTWLLPASIGLLLAVSAVAGWFLYRAMTAPPAEEAPEATEPPGEGEVQEQAAVPRQVTLAGMPGDASVYVDHVLHAERPVVVEAAKTAFTFRVTAAGYEPWEREVAVSSDLTLEVSMTPLGSSAEARKGGKKGKPKPKPAKAKIERTFPGIGQ